MQDEWTIYDATRDDLSIQIELQENLSMGCCPIAMGSGQPHSNRLPTMQADNAYIWSTKHLYTSLDCKILNTAMYINNIVDFQSTVSIRLEYFKQDILTPSRLNRMLTEKEATPFHNWIYSEGSND